MSVSNSNPNLIQTFQLREFQIQLNNGQTRIYNIEQINELDEMIRIYGREIISSIKFLFHNQDPFYYVILRNTGYNNSFIVEFYHYYNQYIERIDICREQKVIDYNTILSLLNTRQHLNSRLVQFIINPFYGPVMS